MIECVFRRARWWDLTAMAWLEAHSHEGEDPDFGVPVVDSAALVEDEISALLKEPNTRGWIIEECYGNHVGYFVIEAEPDGFLLRRLLVAREYRRSGFGQAALLHVYQRMARSEQRKTLTAWVTEGDVETCRWFARMGFSSKLARSRDGSPDDVVFTFTTSEHYEGESVK